MLENAHAVRTGSSPASQVHDYPGARAGRGVAQLYLTKCTLQNREECFQMLVCPSDPAQ